MKTILGFVLGFLVASSLVIAGDWEAQQQLQALERIQQLQQLQYNQQLQRYRQDQADRLSGKHPC